MSYHLDHEVFTASESGDGRVAYIMHHDGRLRACIMHDMGEIGSHDRTNLTRPKSQVTGKL
jgi:hypothetical protein